jgi:predicted RNase H-like nuclease (RuvC/YqgF family)
LDIINSLEFKKFKYTDPDNPKEYLGLMADDVLTNQQLKNCVSKTKYKKVKTNGKIRDSPDYQETIVEEIDDALGLDYHEIFVHGLASIKELSNQNKQLVNEIKELKNEIKQLKKK